MGQAATNSPGWDRLVPNDLCNSTSDDEAVVNQSEGPEAVNMNADHAADSANAMEGFDDVLPA